MKKFETAQLEVMRFEESDIVTASGDCHGHCNTVCPTDCIQVCREKCYDVTESPAPGT